MPVTFQTEVIGEGNHASMVVPEAVLVELGGNRRAALKVTVNGHAYRTTATGVGGQCRVVFPMRDRAAAGVAAGEIVTVELELEDGRREVEISPDLKLALSGSGLLERFEALNYGDRRLLARGVAETKRLETRTRRIDAILKKLAG